MIKLEPFTESDFDRLISWVDSEELLVTIAGNDFTFPLTRGQLSAYLHKEESHSFNVVDIHENRIVGHAEILVKGNDLCKIDKLLIGDKSNRGRGIGQAAISSLLYYSFENLNAITVELNVFDWNVAGIKCYEKCGFNQSPGQPQLFKVKGQLWSAINMSIKKERWLDLRP